MPYVPWPNDKIQFARFLAVLTRAMWPEQLRKLLEMEGITLFDFDRIAQRAAACWRYFEQPCHRVRSIPLTRAAARELRSARGWLKAVVQIPLADLLASGRTGSTHLMAEAVVEGGREAEVTQYRLMGEQEGDLILEVLIKMPEEFYADPGAN